MATVKATLTLSSSDLLTDSLGLSTIANITTPTSTTGLRRQAIGSISRTNRITCLDGDAAIADMGVHEGQFIDITDNHGLKKRYVIIDGTNSSVATGAVVLNGSDIGSGTASATGNLQAVGGIALDLPDTTTQAAALNILKTAIEHADGHNGSITVAAATVATGLQEIVLTNGTAGESSAFLVDADNSTITVILDNTKDAEATNSADNHITVIKKGEFDSPAFVYIKNPSTYHLTNNRLFLYYDNHAAEEILELRGGEFAFMPVNLQNNLLAYTSTAATVIESMVFGIRS